MAWEQVRYPNQSNTQRQISAWKSLASGNWRWLHGNQAVVSWIFVSLGAGRNNPELQSPCLPQSPASHTPALPPPRRTLPTVPLAALHSRVSAPEQYLQT